MARTLSPGVYVQVYRDKLAHVPQATLLAQLDAWRDLGVVGVAWHGRSVELTGDRFAPLAGLCHARGMLALAAFGMDSDDPAGKGRRIGAVARRPDCGGVILDAEGAWEDEPHAIEAEHARALAGELRAAAPDALVVDQPWPVPTMHWSRFPHEEFAAVSDVRAPQFYVNDFRKQFGAARYQRCCDWFERSWQQLETLRLAPRGLVKPRIATFEGYGWSDIPTDLERCLAEHGSVIFWCEPFPQPDVLAALRSVHEQRCVAGPTAG